MIRKKALARLTEIFNLASNFARGETVHVAKDDAEKLVTLK
jgi:hypothetical protein